MEDGVWWVEDGVWWVEGGVWWVGPFKGAIELVVASAGKKRHEKLSVSSKLPLRCLWVSSCHTLFLHLILTQNKVYGRSS